MKKGTRVIYEGELGTVVGDSGFINVMRNKLMLVKFDSEPNAIYYKDITKLEVVNE